MPIICRRSANDFAKDAVEMGERLETDVVSDLADTPVSVEQQRLGLFDPHPGEIIGEGQASSALEQFAKIKCAGVHRLGDGGETEGVVLVPGDELFRAGYGNRFCLGILERNLVAKNR